MMRVEEAEAELECSSCLQSVERHLQLVRPLSVLEPVRSLACFSVELPPPISPIAHDLVVDDVSCSCCCCCHRQLTQIVLSNEIECGVELNAYGDEWEMQMSKRIIQQVAK